ncbi:hypothetical protein EG68_09832 [Paragonimus skrjabini miyazakii]|uniref:Uncharacterized protein n=1 Tax=Paragonimus skrjabini miyazakii TaxID=59628 RepID=A0A8S9YQ86_9TREM|nr:hypothetical protein EG68_09832 [Paragonimus skrjabini miyazakii]
MESFGEQSICVDHIAGSDWSLKQQSGQSLNLDSFGASCHEHECHREKGLTLRFGNYTVVCPFVGGNKQITFESVLGQLSGHIYCPPCSSVCEDTFCDFFSHSVDVEPEEDLIAEEEMMRGKETQTQFPDIPDAKMEPNVSAFKQPDRNCAYQSKDRFTMSTIVVQIFAYVIWGHMSRARPSQ